MSNKPKAAHAPATATQPQNVPPPPSQIEATFTTLQLPISASTSSLSSSLPTQSSTVCQSILYRAESNTQFSRAKAVLWELKLIISSLVSKKGIQQTTTDLQQLSTQFGYDFDKYLIRELLEQIDLKDASKPSRDRSEPVKCLLINDELKRISENPSFLTFFDEISKGIFGEGRHKEFLKEICARLKLSQKMALLIALSLYESSLNETDRTEAAALLKQKLQDFQASGSFKTEPLEEYALHRLLFIFKTSSDFEDANELRKFLLDHHQIKPYQNVALRATMFDTDLVNQNPTLEDPANSLIRLGSGLSHLPQVNKMLDPWQVLIDLGHYSSYNYSMLTLALQDFKDITEKTMAYMLLHLSRHFSGTDTPDTRLVFCLYEINKTADASNFKKEPNDKQTQMQWHVGHFSRAFRENYSNLNWTKVLESFSELTEDISLDLKQFAFFIQLFVKSKPQNLQVPVTLLFDKQWANPNLQLKFITNAIQLYISGEDKTFNFAKCPRRIGPLADLQEVNAALIDVWSSPEVVQILLSLAETNCFTKIRQLFDQPITQCPQYLMFALSQVQTDKGLILVDELISILMTSFIDAHPTSGAVLKKLWEFNQPLMIRSISEICGDNLNKVIDIAQDIKDSLIKFVNCSDNEFAVSLGIIAGKRDFLNYDAWLRERTSSNQFMHCLVKHLYLQVLKPITDQLTKSSLTLQSLASNQTPQDNEKANLIIESALEKANLSKARLTLTLEIVQASIKEQTVETEELQQIRDIFVQISRLVPRQVNAGQNSETEKAANSYFELVFNAEPHDVEQRIGDFINKIRALSASSVERDREILYFILNTFYEEYRFILSFRDQKNLISFAKLFGGIINKNIIEETLMEISIKFIIQALQNNDNRLTFGIVALKQSYQCLSDFPRQFKEIYSLYESKIKEHDPAFHQKFVAFYNQTFSNQTTRSAEEEAPGMRSAGKILDSDVLSLSDFSAEDSKLQFNKHKDRGESQKATKTDKSSFANLNSKAIQSKQNQVKGKSPDVIATKEPNPFSSMMPGGLNIQSEAFNRLPDKPAPQPTMKQSINVNALTFNPTEPQIQESKQYTQSIEVQAWQENIDKKIADAKQKRTEIRFEDLIEDPLLKQISPDAQKEIRFICNNTGTSTFDSQLEKAQNLLQGPNAEANLNWFLHYFLIQRLLTVPQLNIYIELFKQLGNKHVVSKSIKLSVEIMKRCMLIPEEEFNKVMKRSTSQTNIIKSFLQQLGTFIGILTLANNRPIYSSEADLKQMLIEGYRNRNRYVVIFVCRILREAPKAQLQVFNRSNPWVYSLLELLREIYDPQKPSEETQTEIQLVLKEFGINIHDFQTSGFLKSMMTNHIIQASSQQQAEAIFYDKKEPVIPSRVANAAEAQRPNEDPKQLQRNMESSEEFDNELKRHNNQQQIFNSVVITPNQLFRQFKITEIDYRKVISEALEQSIREILPPVVTRSVSIALITTKQLVLKDFTYDADIQKVADAINQFAKNSAGSLALVTCREPLRIALKEYLMKEIAQCCFKFGARNGLSNGNDIRLKDSSPQTLAEADEMDLRLQQYIQQNEELISEVATVASQENLELGCNIIKNTVFDDTAKRIWQDEDISLAMEKRRIATQRGEQFVDEQHVANFQDLPELLRPNLSGLTQNQLRVYSDFSKLNQRSTPHQYTDRITMPLLPSDQVKPKEPAVHQFTLESILADIERVGSLTAVTRALITLKIQDILKQKQADQIKSLWRYVEKKFMDLQMLYEDSQQAATHCLEIIAFIVKKMQSENFSSKLLADVFNRMEEIYLFDVNFNITLLSKAILPLAEWDKQFSLVIKEMPGNQQDKVVQFLVKFMGQAIITQRFLTVEQIPCLVQAMRSLQFGGDSQSQQFKHQIDDTLAQLKESELTAVQKVLKQSFLLWVDLSYIADTVAQEQEMNNYFNDLRNLLQIEKDQTNLFEFCNVSIRTSIELTTKQKSGEQTQNNACLNYHFIDSFIKLVVLLLKAFEFNKQEFMSKILEFIRAKLDADYQRQQKMFNQKPYYRMLINILTAVNISDCFNQRTQKQILFDMADLLNQLRPTNYPAFAFAWLELISHRLFMPHFIKRQDPTSNQAWFQIKDLLVGCFTFLKHHMLPGQKSTPAIEAFYVGTLRIVLLILKDYPDFLCDFHFNFVNSLPDHAIQLKNMILAAVPRSIQAPDPLTKDLRLDRHDVKDPRILSNFEANLSFYGLKEDLDNYFKTKKASLVDDICTNMMKAKEKINGREVPSSAVINAVVLYIMQQSVKDRRVKDDPTNYNDLFQQITNKLNDETRVRFLNSIVNELRYPNSHTYCACFCLNELFEVSEYHIQVQIQKILFERLQSHRPHPWGLSINFRELIQNRVYGFLNNSFIKANKTVDMLFQNRLRPFDMLLEEQKVTQQSHTRTHLE